MGESSLFLLTADRSTTELRWIISSRGCRSVYLACAIYCGKCFFVCGVNGRPALRLNDGDEISARPVGVGAVSSAVDSRGQTRDLVDVAVTALCYYRHDNQENLLAGEDQKNRARIATTEGLTARLERRGLWSGEREFALGGPANEAQHVPAAVRKWLFWDPSSPLTPHVSQLRPAHETPP